MNITLKRLEELLDKYQENKDNAGSTHSFERACGAYAAIVDLIEELKIEQKVQNERKKYRRDRKKRLGF